MCVDTHHCTCMYTELDNRLKCTYVSAQAEAHLRVLITLQSPSSCVLAIGAVQEKDDKNHVSIDIRQLIKVVSALVGYLVLYLFYQHIVEPERARPRLRSAGLDH